MYCNHCGAPQPDGSKFCSNCGEKLAADQAAAKQQPQSKSAPNTQQAAKTEKKKGKLPVWGIALIALAAFLLGQFVIAPAMSPNSDAGDHSGSQSTQSQNGGNTDANPAYEAIFNDTYIVHFQTFFNMEMESFALKQEDGIICCADYGYEDDVVKQWVETMYIPVSEYTDTQKTELENTMKTQFATVEALNCCSVTYKMSTNYFTITCTYYDVDKPENYGELYNAGVLPVNTFISMSATGDTLVNQGFVKK
ncbi:zinc-ribbon domain-containing protein [Phascolarctobacterium sp.]|uniref:zinc-ribbon domain-containing protein n=1 Tax=Phascolarctobacterium sp. TaxID=2049039 RepID=UPI00386391D3